MIIHRKKVVCALLLLCTVLLSSCGPSLDFSNKKKQGIYPDTSDFPNTQWVCREIDMCFYMFSHEEDYLIGTYEVDDVSYRVVATFEFDELNFELYSFTEFSISDLSNSMVHCNRILDGFIYTKYSYDKNANTIVCSIQNFEGVNQEAIPQTLTFEKVGSIAQSPSMRWYSQEIDLYLDSFVDVNGYFRGEIVIGGENCYVHALEIGNNNYFMLSIENGKLNNLRVGTTSPLILMYFEITDNQIIAKVSDEYLSNPDAFPYWSFDGIITFKPLIS